MTTELDSLLDATIDSLEDMPEFKPFPAGAHVVTINWETKPINGRTAIELMVKGISTEDLANPSDEPIKAGDSTSQLFILTCKDGSINKLATGQLKKLLTPLSKHFGTSTTRETMEASNSAQVVVVTSMRTDKRDPQNVKHYTNIEEVIVA